MFTDSLITQEKFIVYALILLCIAYVIVVLYYAAI